MVDKVADLHPDYIKIRVDDNLGSTKKIPPDVYRAVIDEAHKRGFRLFVHYFYLDDAKDLLRSGADMLAHSVRDKEVDDEFIKLVKQRDVPYCPTLTRELSTFVYEDVPPFFNDPFFLREADPKVIAQLKEPARQQAMRESKSAQGYKAALPTAKRNLKKLADAGVTIVMGTDSGATAARFEGYFEHLEMQMMADAGLHAETDPAFGHGGLGARIEIERRRHTGAGEVGRFRCLRQESARRYPEYGDAGRGVCCGQSSEAMRDYRRLTIFRNLLGGLAVLLEEVGDRHDALVVVAKVVFLVG